MKTTASLNILFIILKLRGFFPFFLWWRVLNGMKIYIHNSWSDFFHFLISYGSISHCQTQRNFYPHAESFPYNDKCIRKHFFYFYNNWSIFTRNYLLLPNLKKRDLAIDQKANDMNKTPINTMLIQNMIQFIKLTDKEFKSDLVAEDRGIM